jgi:iron complex outermembrane receptor protein
MKPHFAFSKINVLLALFFLAGKQANAQEALQITGIVTDTTTIPVPYASVYIKGTVIGTLTKEDGSFTITTNQAFPFMLVVTSSGYATREVEIKDKSTSLVINLNTQSMIIDEVVVSASRIQESQLKSPVSIEKLDIQAIKQTPAPSFFDALEGVKGVQMTTLSLGYKVPNTRGFSGTTNSRFLQLVDGVDVTSPGIGAPIANAVGPTELDILNVELIPGAASAIYGMNAINGIANLKTKSPFYHQGLSVYQKTGVNHVGDSFISPQLFNETAFRYAKAFNDKFAFKVNFGYFKGYDWMANDRTDINNQTNAAFGLNGTSNPGYDGINTYGNESSNRKDIKLGDNKTYQIARTGYSEREVADYNVENLKADLALHYKLNSKTEISYSYRLGKADNMYQRGNRIKLDDIFIQQHKLELTGQNYFVRAYHTIENTGKSYALRPLAENLDRSFKSDNQWFADYKTAYNSAFSEGLSVDAAHQTARATADKGRYEPGTPEFEAKRKELIGINNWDKGAALILKTKYYHAEGQYNFTQLKWINLLAGFDTRSYVINPDGNSFINPQGVTDATKLYNQFTYSKAGAFVQASKKFFDQKLNIVGSLRADKQQYFNLKFNPRIAAVYSLHDKYHFRVSYQNGFRFPTLFEAFSFVDNGGVKRLGGLEIMSKDLHIHENSYTRVSQDDFNNGVKADMNGGLTEAQAIEKNKSKLVQSNYGFIKPEHINSFEIGFKTIAFENRLFIDIDFYYNIYKDFIGQVEVARIDKGQIGVDDSTAYYARRSSVYQNNTRFRLWTNSTGIVTNLGSSLGLTWNFYKGFNLSGNFSYAQLNSVSSGDALIPAFNTPKYITNVSIGNKDVYKNVGFNVSWRWQDSFYWDSPLATGTIAAYNTIDAQVNFRIPKAKTTVKFGASNLLNHYYTQYVGGPSIGAMYYVTVTLDNLLNK